MTAERVTFYTVGDARVFPGVVGLLNSLRVTGHEGELFVLDAGFTPTQRGALERHATVVDRPREEAAHPTLYKPFAHIVGATGTVVVLDTDAVVTRSFEPLVATALAGRICAFPDPAAGRFFPEWADMFGVREPLRRERYVSAGFLVFSTERWPDLLPRWWEACRRVYDARLLWGKGDRRSRASPDDQEALNALLMSEVPPGAVTLLPAEEIVHGLQNMAVRVVDMTTLACERNGRPVRYLHAGGSPKPWDLAARGSFRPDAYLRVLRRLLHAPDVTMPYPPEEELPPWLQAGARGAASLYARGMRNGAGSRSFWVETAKQVLPRSAYERLRRSWRLLGAAGPPSQVGRDA